MIVEPKYEIDLIIEHRAIDARYKIVGRQFSRERYTIRYKVQRTRQKFDMFWIEQDTMIRNIENGTFKIVN